MNYPLMVAYKSMKHDGLLLVTNGKVVYEKLFFMNERRETGVSHYNIDI